MIQNRRLPHYGMGMIHQEIEDNEIIERYLRHQLSADERRAFQEHFFTCDECFEKTRMMARLIAGVRQAAVSGVLAHPALAGPGAPPSISWWASWLKPAFAAMTAVALLLAALLGWLLIGQLPRLRQDVERERQARERLERENATGEQDRQHLADAARELENERQQLAQERSERAKLEKQLEALARNQPAPAGRNNRPTAEAPIVILEASRNTQTVNQLTLPAQAASATLWVEVEPGTRFSSFNLQILTSDGRQITLIKGAKRNVYGALAVNLSAQVLRDGNYVVKLYGLENGKPQLVGEYGLRVRRS